MSFATLRWGDTVSAGASLHLSQVTKYYKKFLAVDHIDLTVEKGEFVTILGPSGSGKTSMLKLIAGFEDLTEGEILLNHQDISKMKAFQRNIGMLFQNYALFPHMTVFDNIAYPLKIRKMAKDEIKQKVSEVLELVQLSPFSSRYPKQLSGGQQQRVALARAIVFNPPLLLLDEPLSALDKNLRQKMQLEIKRIQKKTGITTISVTHDQEEALTMSDRICVMNEGKIEQVDTPRGLYSQPNNRFVATFIGEINLIDGEVVEIVGDKATVKAPDGQIAHVSIQNLRQNGDDYINRKASAAIRPENIQIASESGQYETTIRVQVTHRIYVGEAILTKVKTPFGQELTIKVPEVNSDQLNRDELLIGWNHHHGTLVVD
jgi:putative spermidine/putrescine transport system ATP-binding protein